MRLGWTDRLDQVLKVKIDIARNTNIVQVGSLSTVSLTERVLSQGKLDVLESER